MTSSASTAVRSSQAALVLRARVTSVLSFTVSHGHCPAASKLAGMSTVPWEDKDLPAPALHAGAWLGRLPSGAQCFGELEEGGDGMQNTLYPAARASQGHLQVQLDPRLLPMFRSWLAQHPHAPQDRAVSGTDIGEPREVGCLHSSVLQAPSPPPREHTGPRTTWHSITITPDKTGPGKASISGIRVLLLLAYMPSSQA